VVDLQYDESRPIVFQLPCSGFSHPTYVRLSLRLISCHKSEGTIIVAMTVVLLALLTMRIFYIKAITVVT